MLTRHANKLTHRPRTMRGFSRCDRPSDRGSRHNGVVSSCCSGPIIEPEEHIDDEAVACDCCPVRGWLIVRRPRRANDGRAGCSQGPRQRRRHRPTGALLSQRLSSLAPPLSPGLLVERSHALPLLLVALRATRSSCPCNARRRAKPAAPPSLCSLPAAREPAGLLRKWPSGNGNWARRRTCMSRMLRWRFTRRNNALPRDGTLNRGGLLTR